jgi:serine/threonine-protein phosphatase 6 catalytic subunit
MASILTVRGDGGKEFTVFGAAEENEKDEKMKEGRKVVSCVSMIVCSCN